MNKNITDLNVDEVKVLSLWNASKKRFEEWKQNKNNINYITEEINKVNSEIKSKPICQKNRTFCFSKISKVS